MISKLRVSLVIPAYNEAESLRACLQAIACQTVRPYEVIVVDNNSADDTVAVAQSFPFVRVLCEARQGVVYARTAGFDAARGDIIGRIDADTLLPPDWIVRVQQLFTNSAVAAVSGAAHYYDIALPQVVNRLDLFFRRRLARQLAETDTVFLQGANMAVRRSAWHQVRGHLCMRGNMHEDFDLSIHLQECGYEVVFDEQLMARLSARRTDMGFLQFVNYVRMSPHTYALHRLGSRKHMYLIVLLVIAGYVPARILYRSYDAETGNFSWARLLFSRSEARVCPATFTE